MLTPRTADELDEYGLVGRNAAQDDLDRIVIRRKCGEDFMRRRDAFQRQFEARCGVDENAWDEVTRRWSVTLENGERFDSRFLITAIGALSTPTWPSCASTRSSWTTR